MKLPESVLFDFQVDTHHDEIDKGHGRIEKRSIEVTSSMAESLGADWPGCAQVFRLTRERKTGEKVETRWCTGSRAGRANAPVRGN
jgi:hypothetical protein